MGTYIEDHTWKWLDGSPIVVIPVNAKCRIVRDELYNAPYLIYVREEEIPETGEPRLFWEVFDIDGELTTFSGEGYIGSYCIHSLAECFEDAEREINSLR